MDRRLNQAPVGSRPPQPLFGSECISGSHSKFLLFLGEGVVGKNRHLVTSQDEEGVGVP